MRFVRAGFAAFSYSASRVGKFSGKFSCAAGAGFSFAGCVRFLTGILKDLDSLAAFLRRIRKKFRNEKLNFHSECNIARYW